MLPYNSLHCLNTIKILPWRKVNSLKNVSENFECVSLQAVGRCRAVFFASFFFEKK